MTVVRRWMELTGPALGRIAKQDPVAVLPIAAVEQHGPHLPLCTDVTIGEAIVEAALEMLADRNVDHAFVLMPTLVVGTSVEHTRFPGTLSLSAEQAIAQIRSIGASAARAGIRRLVIVNSHGGNQAAMDAAALALRQACGLLVVKVSYYRYGVPPGLIDDFELRHGLHGGQIETSMMLHLAPQLVDRAEIADFRSLGMQRERAGFTLGPESAARFAWMAGDLSPQGVAGNAGAATAAIGRQLVAWYGEHLATTMRETAGFDLSALDTGGDAGRR